MSLAELSRRERKKEETRRRIFESAIAMFREKGFDATTVDEIIEKADVSRATFFNYFPKKESILAYLTEERLAIAEENAAALLAEPTSAREKLIDLYLHAASAWEQDRQLSEYVFQEWLKRAFAPTAAASIGWRKLVDMMVAHGQARGEFRADVDAMRADALLSGVYITTLFDWLFCPQECVRPDFGLADELRTRLTIVFDGLTPRGKEARP
jgi:AcrR family transcriptional regulator